MASRDLILRVQTLARKNGRNSDDYTAQKIALREREARNAGIKPAEFALNLIEEVSPSPLTSGGRRYGYSKCPDCGQNTLIHEDGCMHCRSCGWSACG